MRIDNVVAFTKTISHVDGAIEHIKIPLPNHKKFFRLDMIKSQYTSGTNTGMQVAVVTPSSSMRIGTLADSGWQGIITQYNPIILPLDADLEIIYPASGGGGETDIIVFGEYLDPD